MKKSKKTKKIFSASGIPIVYDLDKHAEAKEMLAKLDKDKEGNSGILKVTIESS